MQLRINIVSGHCIELPVDVNGESKKCEKIDRPEIFFGDNH